MFKKLFGKTNENPSKPNQPAVDPSKDPNMIRVFDEYGRELFITKQQWRDNVLLGNLEKVRNDPDQLYNMIVTAIQDGFIADTLPFAEHLKKIDPVASRAATILGIVYMEVNRLDDAQKVFEEFISKYGEDGIVLTNLAKVYSKRGEETRAESILWHALELDPNQENGLGWYAAIQKERGGDTASLEAYRRVTRLPKSWRARLWVARNALQNKNVQAAELLYAEALALAEHPLPAGLLIQMSGDLGNAGYLAEIIRIVSPHFDPALHGLQVGNNLLKANLDLGRISEAQQILEQLYKQNRHDWKQTLNYWETEIAKAKVNLQAQQTISEPVSVSIIAIEGPVWTRDGSPFKSLMQPKQESSLRIAIFGSMALMEHSSDSPSLQLTNTPGRFSRAIPLKLTESIHLGTDSTGFTLIPWANNQGFALFGRVYDDASLAEIADSGTQASDFVVGIAVNAIQELWELNMWIIRCKDVQRLEEKTIETHIENIGTACEQLSDILTQWLIKHAGVHRVSTPGWYEKLPSPDEQDYLVRLEQQLSVLCKNFRSTEKFGLHNEREILDGTFQLCIRHPWNIRVRMLFAQTLRQMKKVRPDIVAEFKEKTEHFQQRNPLGNAIDTLLENAYSDAFS